MNRLVRVLAILPLLTLPLSTLGQGTVTGTVTDGETGDSLPGVQVVVVGPSQGTVTNSDGSFQIEGVPVGEQTIRAKFVGYNTQTESITVRDGETTTVDFTITPSTVDLNEVVVTGTGGRTEKRTLGNSISSIDAASVELDPVQNISELIQGRKPGVVGLPSGGLAGEGSRIRIRGSASLSQSNEPIVYIDGVRINNGGGFAGLVGTGGGGAPSRLDDINPRSISNVEILKGSAAATLYGTQAANGVIQIFTKRGEEGDLQATFSSEVGVSRFPDKYPSQVGFARSVNQADRMSSVLGREVDPYELVSQNIARELTDGTGVTQIYSGSISGGSDGIKYFISGRYQDESSAFQPEFVRNPGYSSGISPRASNGISRAQGSANLTITPSEDFQTLVSTGYVQTNQASIQTNNNIYGTISLAQFSRPDRVTTNNRSGTFAFATVNESLLQTVNQEVQRFFGSVNPTLGVTENLDIIGKFGVDYTNSFSTEQRPYGWNIDGIAADTPDGERDVSTQNALFLTGDLRAQHNVDVGDNFSSDLTVGAQAFFDQTEVESAAGSDFPGPGFSVVEAAFNTSVQETLLEVVNAGAFAQEKIGFRDYAYLTVGGRYDVNSAFGSDFSGVFYPKAQISFVASDSPFWNENDIVSSLRFRSALGQSGLQPGAFDALTTFSSLSSATGPGLVPDNLGNANLQPEVSTEWEIGTDAGFFNDRLNLGVTYWNRTVSDALVSQQFPPSGGFQSPQIVNIGQLEAQGLEISLEGTVVDGERFSLDAFANTAYLHQKVTDLGGAPPIKVGGTYPRYRNYLVEGFSPGAHFGARLQDTPEGTLPVDYNGDGEPDSRETLIQLLGNQSVSDLNADGVVDLPVGSNIPVLTATNSDSPTGNASDFYKGKPTPDFQGSFGFDATFFDNWTVSTLFEYKAGNYYVNNLTDAFRQRDALIGRNLPSSARVSRNYLTGGLDENGNPQNSGEVRYEALQTWLNDLLALDPFSGLNTIERADFLRLRELRLTYQVPKTLVQGLGASRLSITAAGRNLFLITPYSGVDPELNAVGRGGGATSLENNFLNGVEAFGFPIAREYSLKLQLQF